MALVEVAREGAVARVEMRRGKVNALNVELAGELNRVFGELEEDPEVRSVILTGNGRFFSFGFDIPEFLGYSREAFLDYLTRFTDLYTFLFAFSKPLMAALNGHAVGGGCMLALACDYRIMASGNAKIALNEIKFGSSVFAGSVEMLKFWVGSRNARDVLYSGRLYPAEEAAAIGLVDWVVEPDTVEASAMEMARDLAGKDPAAFASMKRMLRRDTLERMIRLERPSLFEFVDIWYSESTWKQLQEIQIH